MYFADVLRNMALLGCRKILILNGHDGNIGPARGAVAQVANEFQDAALLFVSHDQEILSQFETRHDLGEINRAAAAAHPTLKAKANLTTKDAQDTKMFGAASREP